MKIYAYRVEWNEPENASINLNDIGEFLAGKPFEQRYNDGIRLEDFRERNGLFFLDFSLLRSAILPGKAKRNSPTVALGIDDDDSVSEETACLYHPPTGTMVAQYNLHGPKKKTIEQYLNYFVRQTAEEVGRENWQRESFFELLPYLTQDTNARFQDMRIFRNIEFKVVVPPVGPEDRAQGASLDDVLRWGVNGGAQNAIMKFSAGREQNASLASNFITALVRRFNRGDAEFERLRLKAKQGAESAVEMLDFVEALLKTETVVSPGGDRRLPRIDRYAALENAFQSWLRTEQLVL